ncbi:MAG TPA: PHP domain-containing protein, partial [bacterium]|nr:PHP domain-containing protein [bacterium]
MTPTPFCHLHLHTEYSLLNGALRIPQAIALAKQTNMPALAITDYGNIFGAVEFFGEAKAQGIKPILGCELFLPSTDDHKIKKFVRGQDVYWQIVLLVMNQTGYLNLSQLITKSYLEGFYYKPRVDTKLLAQHNEGLIALSSGFHSEINHHLYGDNLQAAKAAAQKYAALFPDRFYIELQDHGLPDHAKTNGTLVKIANELGIPTVATNNIHYLKPDDAEAFEMLRAIQLSPFVASPYDSLQFTTDSYYFKSAEEMQNQFAEYADALSNTKLIAEKCHFSFETGKYHLPRYEPPKDKTLNDYLAEQAREGLHDRWPQIQKVSKATQTDLVKYQERLEHEIKVVQEMGFAGYFLI